MTKEQSKECAGQVFIETLIDGDLGCLTVIGDTFSQGDYQEVSGALTRAVALHITGKKLTRLYKNCGSDGKNLISNLLNLDSNNLNILANTNY